MLLHPNPNACIKNWIVIFLYFWKVDWWHQMIYVINTLRLFGCISLNNAIQIFIVYLPVLMMYINRINNTYNLYMMFGTPFFIIHAYMLIFFHIAMNSYVKLLSYQTMSFCFLLWYSFGGRCHLIFCIIFVRN